MSAQIKMKQPPSQLAGLVRRASQTIERLAGSHIEPLGLTYRQMVVLITVLDLDGGSQREVATATGIDRTTVTNICRTLEQRQLLNQRKNPLDARSVRVTLTAEGKRLASEGLVIMKRIEGELTRTVKPCRAALDEALLKLVEMRSKKKNGEKA